MRHSIWKTLSAGWGRSRLVSSFAALLLAGCSSFDAPYAPVDASRRAPGAPNEALSSSAMAGSRSGDGAITRNNIDAILSNPRRADARPPVKAAEERPGLATGYGESISSPWNRQSFVRAASKPAGTGVVYYNNREGIEAMSGGKRKAAPMQSAAGEMIEWGIKGGFGFLPVYESWYQSRRFVVGRKDANYSIVLKNRCKSRLEVVLSVDGLDVIDGKLASFAKRGYVIAPGETLEVKGWRTGPDSVARFRFSSVAGSYANLSRGDHRNVGVIGLAVFGEKGIDPWTWMPSEVRAREAADPFGAAP